MTSVVKQPRAEIILVDGDVEVAAMIAFGLTSAGYSVKVYGTGISALDALLAVPSDGLTHLVILAVDLVGVDGHTLHEQLKLARPGEFQVVFLSIRGSDADQIRAFTAGALDYLIKPVSIPVLISRIPNWLKLGAGR